MVQKVSMYLIIIIILNNDNSNNNNNNNNNNGLFNRFHEVALLLLKTIYKLTISMYI